MSWFKTELTEHAVEQMEARCITADQIREVLQRGERIWQTDTVKVVYNRLVVVVSACWQRVVTVYDKNSELRVTLEELLSTK